MFVYVRYCSVRNTKFSQQCVESPKFLSLHEHFSNSKPMFPSLLKLTMPRFRTERRSKFACAKFPPRCPLCCLLRFCREHNARVHLTFLLTEMYGCSRLCDRLRSSAIIWKQLSLRSSAIRDRLRSYGNQPLDSARLSEQEVPSSIIGDRNV